MGTFNRVRQPTCFERIDTHMASTVEDLRVFMEDTDGNEDTGPFHEYGLCFDLVEMGTFDGQEEPYFRYQISWGGPSSEVRFFPNGRVEYWFMDWFDGAHKDVTREDWAVWLKDTFEDLNMMNWE